MSAAPLSRDELAGLRPHRRIRGRNSTKADILVYRLAGREVAVKDYGARGFWVRHTVGRALVRREAAAYRRAGTVAGLPEFLGRLGPFSLATAWLDASPLAERPAGSVEASCFDQLEAILARLHARGVALGDLHHRDVLVSGDGAVSVVDLAAAWLDPGSAGIRRRLFRRACQLDRLAAWRMRRRFLPGAPAAPAGVDATTLAWHRRGRALKGWFDRLRRRHRD